MCLKAAAAATLFFASVLAFSVRLKQSEHTPQAEEAPPCAERITPSEPCKPPPTAGKPITQHISGGQGPNPIERGES